MKITGNQVNPVPQTYLGKVQKVRAGDDVEQTHPQDQVELSPDAAAIDTARQVIGKLPDLRVEKVDKLRRQVQNGTYQVEADKVADKILAEMRLSKLGEK